MRPRHPHLAAFATGVLCLVLVLVLVWGVGFLWFVNLIDRPTTPPPRADGIVALTGGAERIETALRLLQEDHARLLLISGTGTGAELAVLAHRAGVEPGPLSERVTLGREATSTRGNALETATWARANNIHSLIVVTAFYHMPRALTELHRALPDVTLYPLPVLTPAQPAPPGSTHLVTLRLMAEEYSKFLAALVGLSVLAPQHEAPAAHGAHTE